jgi:hypothetical protein
MREVKPGKKYKHFKGDTIEVICIALDSETLEEQVVYKHNGKIWIRNKAMFLSKVDKEKYPNIEQVYRFEEI